MTAIVETTLYETEITQLETTDLILGGVGGTSNRALVQIANRTNWLHNQVLNKVNWVGTTQALRDLPLTDDPVAVCTLAAAEFGDGGWGVWHWDATSEEDDNFVTVVCPAGRTAPGRWKRALDGDGINLLWCGLPQNGVDDDAAPITAIIAATGFRKYRLPAGSYHFGTTLLIERQEVALIGDGEFATWVYRIADGYDLIQFRTPDDGLVAIKHCEVSGMCLWSEINGLINTSGAALRITWGARFDISRIQARGGYEGFCFEALTNSNISHLHAFTNNNFGGAFMPGSSELRFDSLERTGDVRNCSALNVQSVICNLVIGHTGGWLERNVVITGSDGIWFTGCHFGWADKGPLLIRPTIFPSGAHTNIIGLIFNEVHFDGQDGQIDYGVEYQLPAGYAGSVKGHIYSACKCTAFDLAGYKVCEDPNNSIQNIVWSGCGVQLGTGWGYDIAGGQGLRIGNVHIEDCDAGGIRLRNSDYCTIDATFDACTVGVSIDQGSTRCKIEGTWINCGTDLVVEAINGSFRQFSVSGTTSKSFDINAADTLIAPPPRDFFRVNGTTTITGIDPSQSFIGRQIVLQFEDATPVVDGAALRLSSSFTASANDTLHLVCTGEAWCEIGRSFN